MAVTEASRYKLHKHYEETMGHELATTVMELLPPVGWGDVATKQDLALVKQDLALVKQDLALVKQELKHDIAGLREWASERFATKADLHRELRVQTITIMTVMLGFAGVLTALVR